MEGRSSRLARSCPSAYHQVDVVGRDGERAEQVNECIMLDVAALDFTHHFAGVLDSQPETVSNTVDHHDVDTAMEHVGRDEEQRPRHDQVIELIDVVFAPQHVVEGPHAFGELPGERGNLDVKDPCDPDTDYCGQGCDGAQHEARGEIASHHRCRPRH